MKSYFLEGVSSVANATMALSEALPGQKAPWVLQTQTGEIIGYFDVVDNGVDDVVSPAVQVDVSGRHWDKIGVVLSTLESLRLQVGGKITTDE